MLAMEVNDDASCLNNRGALSSFASKLAPTRYGIRAMLPTLQTDRDAAMSAPSMTLYHNALSPFVRKVMVLLHETGQQDRVALQSSLLTPVSPDLLLNEDNPVGKIPALRLADGNVIHDSRVILDYLDHQHVGNPLIPRDGSARWRRLTLASIADGIMDAAVLIRYELALRAPEKHWEEWLDGQRDKIRRALALLEKDAIAELTSHFDVAAISVACALGYLDLRHPNLEWREANPQLAAWYFEVSQRPSMVATMPKV
ncbi:MAG: glutathione S-transferase-like protein [Pseudomonas sp.]|nr:glutathione S-transferase-like protein [Pseudomonas sp.]